MAMLPRILACMLTLAATVMAPSQDVNSRHIPRRHGATATIWNPVQLVMGRVGADNYTVVLDGSESKDADSYKWTETSRPSKATKRAVFTAKRAAVTNVTIGPAEGTYVFQLRVESKLHGKSPAALSKVYLEKPTSVGMYLFASNVVSKLLEMQYEYIVLSQHHLRADNYHPKVAQYFRKLASDRGAMLQEVTEHVLAKQATEDLINSCPTDYVAIMMSEGFKNDVTITAAVTSYMTSAFDIAKDSETKLGQELAQVSHHAEKNDDYELSEFVAADLLPRVTKVINAHKSYLETILRRTDSSPQGDRYLVEFLFDKYLKL